MNLYRNESSYAKNNAQRNLCGYYVTLGLTAAIAVAWLAMFGRLI